MFQITHTDNGSLARSGILRTAHGRVLTPAFVPVATKASIKAVEPDAIADIGVQIVINNTYHLHLQPGEDAVAALGGVHGFSGWTGPTMTDSGGFQVFSLGAGKEQGVGKVAPIFPGQGGVSAPSAHAAFPTGRNPDLGRDPDRDGGKRHRHHPAAGDGPQRLVKLTEEGAWFRSIIDGSPRFFSPEGVMDLERKLGADLILVLDECTSPLHDYAYTQRAMLRTHRWAKRCLDAFGVPPTFPVPNPEQRLYGIVQGGAYEDLRRESAAAIGEMPFDGLAIGGSLGRSKEDMLQVLEWSIPILPNAKPRHLLGIGEIEDIFPAVRRGIDTMDCAAATRIARNGTVFLKGEKRHRINLRNARFKLDARPIDETCDCPTCRRYSRAYLRHLCRSGELSFYRMATLHNLRFLVRLMDEIRTAIREDRFDELEREWQVH
ncbi:tRNA guanosine(34) transglycosylase Tgt [Candidatus Bipolaricaulota bacterium]|nr:tRNA guanosine(34) transglycosylase Tgt [Candidatus Bipolaricaulota bacterium]